MKRSRLACAWHWMPLGAALLLLAGCGTNSNEGKTLDRADAALARGDYNEAMVLLHGVLQDAPGNGRAQLLAARGAMMLGDYKASASALDAAQKAGVAEVAPVRGELLFRSGQSKELLTWLDQQNFDRTTAWVPALRVRALAEQQRCDEAIPMARALEGADKQSSALVAVAECYARGGNVARAARELRAIVAATPDDAEAWLALGRALQATRDIKGAEEAWNEAAKHAKRKLSVPHQALLYSALAELQANRGDVAALRATHKQLISVVPGAPITEMLDARIALLEGKAGDAVATLQRLIVKSPDLPVAHSLLLVAYLEQGTFEQARQELGWLEQKTEEPKAIGTVRQALEALTKTKPGTPPHYLLLANAQSQLGLLDLANATLGRGLRETPSDPTLLLALAQSSLRTGHAGRAVELLKPLAESSNPMPAVLPTWAEALDNAGRYAEADAVLSKIASRSPNAGIALAQFSLRKRGNLEGAREPLEQWLAKRPDDHMVRAAYADALRESGDNARAIAQYEQLIAKNPQSAWLFNNLAWLYVIERDPRAVATARRATELSPKSPETADTYGWALVRAGSAKEAVPILEAIDKKAGITQPETRYHFAAALAGSGEKERARALLEPLLAEAEEFSGRDEAARLLAELSANKANVTQ